MKTITQFVLSLSLAGFAFTLPGLANSATDNTTRPKLTSTTEQQAQYFFVLRSASCTVMKTKQGYDLTLQGIDNNVLYFTDRPIRSGGFITLNEFMLNWSNGSDSFKNIPPNAVLIHPAMKTDAKGVAKAVATILSNPVKIDKHTWKFQLQGLTKNLQAGHYDRVSVLIDLSVGQIPRSLLPGTQMGDE